MSVFTNADAELLNSGGEQFGLGFAPEIMRLHPFRIIAWGIDPQRQSRRIKNMETHVIQNHVIKGEIHEHS